MRKTYSQLHKELFHKTKSEENLRKRVSSMRVELREYRERQHMLLVQYERIVRDWKKEYENLLYNGWKIVFVKINRWFNEKRGRKVLKHGTKSIT